eukprot:11191428-Lingulodinium_polyedra.AAC.1
MRAPARASSQQRPRAAIVGAATVRRAGDSHPPRSFRLVAAPNVMIAMLVLLEPLGNRKVCFHSRTPEITTGGIGHS